MYFKYSVCIIIKKYVNNTKYYQTSLRKYLKKFLYSKNNTNFILLIKKNGDMIKKKKLKNVNCQFLGKNNIIKIYEPFNFKHLSCTFYGNNNKLIIKDNSRILQKMSLVFESNNLIEIGQNFSLQKILISLRNGANTKILIGDNCMFSHNIEIRPSDAHIIYDINTKEITNMPKDIVIGNHVWLAAGSKVLKGAKIPDNCIVGANSLVTKAFEEKNCIIAGSPAKIIKRGVNWHKCGPHQWDSYKDFV